MTERRRAVGVLVKSTDVVTEGDLARLCPAPVRLHVTRVKLDPGESPDTMEARLGPACAELADVRPELVVLACASATFAGGAALDDRITATIGSLAACPIVTAASALVDGARALSLTRVLLMSPYTNAIDDGIRDMFGQAGIAVAAVVGLRPAEIFQPAFLAPFGGTGNRLIDPTWLPEMAGRALVGLDDIDGIVIACTGLRVSEILALMEADTGLPVVAANQATAAAIQRALGLDVPVPGFGRLLEATPISPH